MMFVWQIFGQTEHFSSGNLVCWIARRKAKLANWSLDLISQQLIGHLQWPINSVCNSVWIQTLNSVFVMHCIICNSKKTFDYDRSPKLAPDQFDPISPEQNLFNRSFCSNSIGRNETSCTPRSLDFVVLPIQFQWIVAKMHTKFDILSTPNYRRDLLTF